MSEEQALGVIGDIIKETAKEPDKKAAPPPVSTCPPIPFAGGLTFCTLGIYMFGAAMIIIGLVGLIASSNQGQVIIKSATKAGEEAAIA